MAAHLRGLDAEIGRRPRAVLVVSAHWEAETASVNASSAPGLLYDYYGFPASTYRLAYPAPGSPEVAARVQDLLEASGLPVAIERERGLDHGVFIPFMLIYPDAAIPVVQLSLIRGLSPRNHLEMGRALAPLRDEDVLIVGSGMTYHNLRDMGSDRASREAEAFDDWLGEVLKATDEASRCQALSDWAEAPGARYAHPREEHLMPLMIAAGAAGKDPGRRLYGERLGGRVAQSGFRFG